MMKKIVILGNSVAVRIRPHIKESSRNYGQRLTELLSVSEISGCTTVENLGFGRATISQSLQLRDEIINRFGDYYIINLGVVDAASREIPLWWADINNRKRAGWLRFIFLNIYAHLLKPRRRFFTVLRGKRAWISDNQFRKEYALLIDIIQKNTSGKIICLSILNANDRVERQLPGSRARYVRFNNFISEIAAEKAVTVLSLDDFIGEAHYPDGTHLNDSGHDKLAHLLSPYLKS